VPPSFSLTPDANRPTVFANWISRTEAAPAARVAAELVALDHGKILQVTKSDDGRFLLPVPQSWGCRVVFGQPGESLGIALATLMRRSHAPLLRRLRWDQEFRRAWLREGIQSVVDGDLDVARAILRFHINGASSWEVLEEAVGVPAKSLMRMLGREGNPRAFNLLQLLSRLQAFERLRFRVEPESRLRT
jgi:hypothetical protein